MVDGMAQGNYGCKREDISFKAHIPSAAKSELYSLSRNSAPEKQLGTLAITSSYNTSYSSYEQREWYAERDTCPQPAPFEYLNQLAEGKWDPVDKRRSPLSIDRADFRGINVASTEKTAKHWERTLEQAYERNEREPTYEEISHLSRQYCNEAASARIKHLENEEWRINQTDKAEETAFLDSIVPSRSALNWLKGRAKPSQTAFKAGEERYTPAWGVQDDHDPAFRARLRNSQRNNSSLLKGLGKVGGNISKTASVANTAATGLGAMTDDQGQTMGIGNTVDRWLPQAAKQRFEIAGNVAHSLGSKVPGSVVTAPANAFLTQRKVKDGFRYQMEECIAQGQDREVERIIEVGRKVKNRKDIELDIRVKWDTTKSRR